MAVSMLSWSSSSRALSFLADRSGGGMTSGDETDVNGRVVNFGQGRERGRGEAASSALSVWCSGGE